MFENKEKPFQGEYGNSLNFQMKELNDDGEFEGYAATFNEVDRGFDEIVPGAFTESIKMRPAKKVKMLLQHNAESVLGMWSELTEDSKGLYCKGKLILGLNRGRETHELMKAGAIDGLSIGYRTDLYEINEETNVRKLKKVELFEISIVTFPMNDNSLINRVKSDELPTERDFEQFLVRDAGFTVSQAKRIVSSGYKSLKVARDAEFGDDGGVAKLLAEAAAKIRC